MNFLVFLFFIFYIQQICASNITQIVKPIVLTSTNTLIIKGEINDKLATQFIYQLNQKDSKNNLFVYLDTNGGSVDAGNKIVNEIIKYKLDCIASTAISMGFVILQSCKNRYITDFSTLMQHQMSYGIMNEKEKIESYVNYIKQIDNRLTKLQSKKIGIDASKFKKKTYNDWWLFGENAIHENCADKIVDVKCSAKLTNQTYTVDKGQYTYVYSKCPLVSGHIDKKKNKNNDDFIFYF